ncbi:MAG: hypothetical protein LUG99_00565 [Lachnospiraceae bacterium]|nr:hypothetical protein [Lachnospiraceae bacterium]
MCDEESFLELLEIFMELNEKQDEIIVRLSRLLSKQATELAHLRNLMNVEASEDMQKDENILTEVMEEYESMKLEP